MSKSRVLSQIDRLERIADMLEDTDENDLNSLAGQAMGAIYAIGDEFSSAGISVKSQYLSDLGPQMQSSVQDAVYALHAAAGYFRGKAEQL